ncbi:hypothetical protein CHUAL_004183 [Chamberlinius hualienensis]
MRLLFTIILILFSIFQSGVCQTDKFVVDHKVITGKSDGRKTYECKLGIKVDCLWQKDGQTFSLKFYNYAYTSGNGKNTEDCSITGPSHENATKFENLQQDSGAKLYCKSKGRVICSWKRNGDIVIINDRYNYIGGHNGRDVNDCSIKINKIQPIDQGKWLCYRKADDYSNYQYILAAFNLKINNESSATSNKNQMNSDSDRSQATVTAPENHLIIYLPAIGILTAIIIGLVIYVRKFRVSSRNSSSHESDLVEFKTAVARQSKMIEEIDRQTPTDLPKNTIESADGYLIPKCDDESEKIKHHTYEKLNFNIKNDPTAVRTLQPPTDRYGYLMPIIKKPTS